MSPSTGRVPPGAALDQLIARASNIAAEIEDGMWGKSNDTVDRSMRHASVVLRDLSEALRAALDAQPPQAPRVCLCHLNKWCPTHGQDHPAADEPPQAPQKEPERSGEIVCPHCRAPLYRIVKAKPRPFHFDPEDND